MKSRKILAAVMAPVCAVSAMAVVASATDTSTADTVLSNTVTEFGADWKNTKDITIDKAKFASAKAGDKIVVAFSEIKDGVEVYLKDTSAWKELPSGGTYKDIAKTFSTIRHTLTAEDVTKIKETGLAIQGLNATVTSVSLRPASTETDPNAVDIDLEMKYDSQAKAYVPGVNAYSKIDLTKPATVDASKIATVVVKVKSNTTQSASNVKGVMLGSGQGSDWLQGDYTAATRDEDYNFVFTLPLGLKVNDSNPARTAEPTEINWSAYGIAFGDFGGMEYDNANSCWKETPSTPVTAKIISVQFLDADGNDLNVTEEEEESSDSSTTTSSESSTTTSSESSTTTSSESSTTTSSDSSTTTSESKPATSDEDKPAGDDKTDSTDKTETPGATDKAETVTNTVTVDKVLKGAELSKAVFGDSKKEWKDVETITFESDEPFAVVFDVKAGKIKGDDKATTFVKGVNELAKADLPAEAFATKWTLSKDEVAAMLEADPTGENTQIISKDGKKIQVKATVTLKADAASDDKTDNKNTGIALAVAPVIFAGAAVAVVSLKKRK